MRVRLLSAAGEALPGFDAADCRPIEGDGLTLPVEWKEPLGKVKGKPVRIGFQMQDAQLYSFDLE